MNEALPFNVDKLVKANANIRKRMEKEGIVVVYDDVLDTLFIQIAGPKEALNDFVSDDIMVRIDPSTLGIVGFEIMDFFDDFAPSNRLVVPLIESMGIRRNKSVKIVFNQSEHFYLKRAVENITAALVDMFIHQTKVAEN